MSNSNKFDDFEAYVCQSDRRHEYGRPPRGPYHNMIKPLCRDCLIEHLAEGTLTICFPTQFGKITDPRECHRIHYPPVPAEIRLNGTPVCWSCADAQLRIGKPLKLALLDSPKVSDPDDRRGA